MEIRKRIGLPRMQFHVMNRGARKVAIFANDADRSLFVKLLGHFALKHEVTIHSWCLMPNHYHVEPESEGTPLSRMMHDLDGTYAQAYNERHKTTGCLFQGTFKSMWVRDLEGLVYVSRYIHVNCRDLKIRPDRYRWSSYRSYLGLEPVPAWLETRAVLDYWKDDSKPVEQSYRDYVDAAPPPRHRSKRKGAEWGDFWVDYVRHLEERCVEWSIPLAAWLGRTSLQSFVCWVAQRVFDIPPRWVAEFYGLENGRAVVARSSRFQERVDQEPELGLALESVVKW